MAEFDRFFRITMRSCEKRCRWAARVSPIERTSYGRGCIGRKFYAGSADAVCRFMRLLGGAEGAPDCVRCEAKGRHFAVLSYSFIFQST